MSTKGDKQADSQGFPTHEEIVAKGYVKKSRREKRIQSRPRVAQMYWVDFPHDAYEPEFVGEHPGIVIRAAKALLHDTCIIVPVSTSDQKAGSHFHQLSKNPNPRGQNIVAFAVCDHLYTVHVNRLRPMTSAKGMAVFPKVEQADFDKILSLVQGILTPVKPTTRASAEDALV